MPVSVGEETQGTVMVGQDQNPSFVLQGSDFSHTLSNDSRRRDKCIGNTAKMKRVEVKGDMESVRGSFLEEAVFIL